MHEGKAEENLSNAAAKNVGHEAATPQARETRSIFAAVQVAASKLSCKTPSPLLKEASWLPKHFWL